MVLIKLQMIQMTIKTAKARPATDQQPTTPNNDKNDNNVNNEKNIIPFSKEKGSPPACPHQKIINEYHQKLPMCPQVRVWSEASKRHLQIRWREDTERQRLEFWQALFEYIKTSKFLTGSNDRGWIVDLAWIVNADNFAKIINGRYHNDKKTKTLSEYQAFLNSEN